MEDTKSQNYYFIEIELSGSLGNDLRDIATEIHLKNKEAQDMMEFTWKEGDGSIWSI